MIIFKKTIKLHILRINIFHISYRIFFIYIPNIHSLYIRYMLIISELGEGVTDKKILLQLFFKQYIDSKISHLNITTS